MKYYICKKCQTILREEDVGEIYDNETGMYVDFCPFCGNYDHLRGNRFMKAFASLLYIPQEKQIVKR